MISHCYDLLHNLIFNSMTTMVTIIILMTYIDDLRKVVRRTLLLCLTALLQHLSISSDDHINGICLQLEVHK